MWSENMDAAPDFEHDMTDMRRTVRESIRGRVREIERNFPSRDEMERAIFNSVKCLHDRNQDLSNQVANLQIANQLLHKRFEDLETALKDQSLNK